MKYIIIVFFFLVSCGTYKRSEKPRILTANTYAGIDTDKDGIIDKFDKCPKTPKGISVNSKGCPKDTDGDGVADYKDKELITATVCQPSNADGIGVCPSDDGPIKMCDFKFKSEWIGFSHLSYKLDGNAIKAAERFSKQMRRNPSFPVQIKGYGSSSYSQQQASWSRVFAIRNLLVDSFGVDSDRIGMLYGKDGASNYLVELKGFDKSEIAELIGKTLPPPNPGLIDKKNKRIKKWRH